MPRVVALDLDGTVLRSDGTVSPRTILTLRRCVERGMRIVVATSRPPRSVAARLPPDFPGGTWICYNGAEIFEEGQRIAQFGISPELTQEIVHSIQHLAPDAAVSVEIDNCLYADRELHHAWAYEIVNLATLPARPAAKVLFDATQVSDLEILRAHFTGRCRVIVLDRGVLGQVMLAAVSKAAALRWVLEQSDLSIDDAIAFGDDLNDVEMLSECGIGVAMDNACAEVKAVADWVTLTNDEDGVALVLESLLEGSVGTHGLWSAPRGPGVVRR